jgi:hypothetical protein
VNPGDIKVNKTVVAALACPALVAFKKKEDER